MPVFGLTKFPTTLRPARSAGTISSIGARAIMPASGPAAHGRLTIDGVRHHLATLRLPEAWLASVEAHGHGLDQRHALEPRQWAAEFLLMGIRLAEGFDLDRYRALGGEISAKGLAMLKQQNLVEFDGQVLKAAAEGRLVLDAVIAELSDWPA